jgi:hypothetical protein
LLWQWLLYALCEAPRCVFRGAPMNNIMNAAAVAAKCCLTVDIDAALGSSTEMIAA